MKKHEVRKLLFFGILLTLVSAHGEGVVATNTPSVIVWSEIATKAGADYKGDGLAVRPTESGARLHCVFQRLDGEATPGGLWLTSTATNMASDSFRVIATEVERTGADGLFDSHDSESSFPLADAGTVFVEGQTVRFVRSGFTEEYSVSMDGVRQDFIVAEPPPAPPAGQLVVKLAVTGAEVELAASGARLVLENSGRMIAYSRLRVTDATGKELPAWIKVCRADEQALSFTNWNESGRLIEPGSLFTRVATEAQEPLAVVVDDADAVYPVRIDPTFSDANWVSMGGFPGIDGDVYASVVDGSGNVYIGGDFAVAGETLANNVAMWNGSSWSALGSGIGGYSPVVKALAVSGGTLYAGGYFTTAGASAATNIAQWNGISWSALGLGMNNDVDALAVSSGTLYAGGWFTTAGGSAANYIAQWNGSSWSALGSGMGGADMPYVNALAVSGGTLYAGGFFTTAGYDTDANYIAQWNGNSWSGLGSGMNEWVQALAVSGGTLYAGGFFSTAGDDTNANFIAQWNGSSWSALGSGVGGGVWALAASGGTLYAGGAFGTAGDDTNANSIAQWNGSSWSALGSGMAGGVPVVFALAVSGGTLYAGGDFTTAGSSAANYIAQWNGSSWSPLGSGMNDSVFALAVSGGTLYAGGFFSTAGGSAANSIAQWNGSSWSPLGSGMIGEVIALAVSGGTLYAGGSFTNAGGHTANNIAQWNGRSWSPLGSGIVGDVEALAVSGGTLYAGGDFTTAGDDTNANSIAQWNGSSWSPLGSGITGSYFNSIYHRYVDALAVSGGTLYVGGAFTAAGTNVSAFAAETIVGSAAPYYTISVSASPISDGSARGAGTFPSGGAQTVTAEANSGNAFVDWTENGTVVSSSANYTFTLNSNVNLVANFAPLTKGNPKLTITSPKAGQSVTGSNYVFTVTGTTTDKVSVTNVSYQFNGGSWTSATPINSWRNWTAGVTFNPGTNIFRAYAVDASGAFSPTNTVAFKFIPSAMLQVKTNGLGSIMPVDNGKLLAVGTNYTLTASPAKNWLFSNWVASGSENFVSNNPVLTFNMQSNLLLQANFVPNPFIQEQGTFSGLFLDSNDVTEASSGFFTLALATSGAFTGKIMTSGSAYSLPTTNKFDAGGQVEFTIPTEQATLTFNLQLNIIDPASEQITGTVSNGTWTAALIADRAVFNASTNKAVNYQGQYTMAIAGSDDVATSPCGFGYATLTINSAGLITMTGNLADGTAISQSVSVSKDGRWPFYASYAPPPAGNGGAVFAWLTFSNLPASALGGTMYWFRPAGKTPAVYQTGFTNLAVPVIGSAYNPVHKPLLSLTSAEVILRGGNLPFTITNQITLASNNTITVPVTFGNTNKLTLTINKTTGAISGAFTSPPNPIQTLKVNGVLIENQTNAAGYFLGSDQSGAFLLEGPYRPLHKYLHYYIAFAAY